MRTPNQQTKTKFILAAIEEMKRHGISDFSVRRVAEICGTSPAAPYRHFGDKNGLIIAVFEFVNESWRERLSEVVSSLDSDDPRLQLIEITMAYIRFMCDHPDYQTILMINDGSMSPEQLRAKAGITTATQEIIARYCESVGMSDDDRIRKTYAVRSFMFGAALMINSGYMPYNETTLGYARSCIAREFDLK